MYSSYYKPPDGRESTVLTDHEALHRDEAVHKSMQSDETQLRPLDLETIMSSKAAVKFWYLHRPKTMEFVHTKATKIQSLGRAFAVRRLKERYGMEYVVELAKEHTEKKEADKMNDLSDEERIQKEKEDAEYEARVEESKRLRREQIERERKEEEELRARLAAEAASKEEEDRLRKEAEELEQQRQEEERLRLEAEEKKRKEEEEEEALRLAAIEKQRQGEEEEERKRLEEEERQREEEAEKERLRLEEEERQRKEEEERLRREEEGRQREAEAIERKRRAEEEQRRLEREEQERVEREKKERRQREKEERRRKELEAIKAEKYEQSLSKNVPVIVRRHGAGRVEHYDKERETYMVKLEKAMGGLSIEVRPDDINLDDDRILSPRTVVDTPFGVGEVVGLDPHVGCYAIKTELGGTDGEENMAFVQIPQVHVHQEEEEEKAIVEDPQRPIPDEIKLVAARIVDSRVVHRTGKKFIQYKLEVQTSNYGTVYCWKRYSTFRSLCDRLHKESGVRRRDIPELPHRQILGNFSQSVVGDRSEKLNAFLRSAVQADHLQWGIRVDDKIAVYKRRVKKPSSGGIFSRRR